MSLDLVLGLAGFGYVCPYHALDFSAFGKEVDEVRCGGVGRESGEEQGPVGWEVVGFAGLVRAEIEVVGYPFQNEVRGR